MLLLRKHQEKLRECIRLGIDKSLVKLKYGGIPEQFAFMVICIHLYYCVTFAEYAFIYKVYWECKLAPEDHI